MKNGKSNMVECVFERKTMAMELSNALGTSTNGCGHIKIANTLGQINTTDTITLEGHIANF